MGPASVAVVVSIVLVALGFLGKGRGANKDAMGCLLAGTWEGTHVEIKPNSLPMVGYLRLTLSPNGTYQNEVRAFLGSMPLGQPETIAGTYTYEPGAEGETGVLEVKVCQPKPAIGKGTVVWLSKDKFIYTSGGTTVHYSRVA